MAKTFENLEEGDFLYHRCYDGELAVLRVKDKIGRRQYNVDGVCGRLYHYPPGDDLLIVFSQEDCIKTTTKNTTTDRKIVERELANEFKIANTYIRNKEKFKHMGF